MRFILEDEDESEEVELSFIEALKKWVKGGVTDDYLTDAESMIEVPWRKNQILAQTKLKYQFDDDDEFLKILDLNDDDIHFLKGVNSHYGWEFTDSYGVEEDFKEGYGVLSHFNEENKEKWNKISIMLSGKPFDFQNPDTDFLRNVLKAFPRQIDNLIDEFHWRKEEMMRQTAIEDTDKELKKYLGSIGFTLSRDWDMVSTTPANLIMFSHLLRMKEGSFEDLFKKIVEKNPPNIGGWWDNMYEFENYNSFDEVGLNRDIEKNLDSILENLEEDPELSEFFNTVMKITEKYKLLSQWYPLPSNKMFKFKIYGFDSESKKIIIILGKNIRGDYFEKRIKISPETFYKILHQPTLFNVDQIFEQRKPKMIKEGFDPIYFIKNFFKEKKEVFDRGDSWEMKDEMQKYVDVLYKLVQKSNPSKSIKGLEVVKVSRRGFIRSFETNLKQEIIVVVNAVLPSWENPNNEKLVKEFDFYKELFKKILRATGMDYDTATGTEFKFHLYLK